MPRGLGSCLKNIFIKQSVLIIVAWNRKRMKGKDLPFKLSFIVAFTLIQYWKLFFLVIKANWTVVFFQSQYFKMPLTSSLKMTLKETFWQWKISWKKTSELLFIHISLLWNFWVELGTLHSKNVCSTNTGIIISKKGCPTFYTIENWILWNRSIEITIQIFVSYHKIKY